MESQDSRLAKLETEMLASQKDIFVVENSILNNSQTITDIKISLAEINLRLASLEMTIQKSATKHFQMLLAGVGVGATILGGIIAILGKHF